MKEANERAAQQQAAYNQFANSIMNEIRGLNSFAGQDLELSKEDVDDLSAFMLDIDENGLSPFGKAMQDPSLFTRAAFWLLNEDKIIEELTKQMQDTYTRGYENAKKDMQGKSKLVINKSESSTKKQTDYFDDEDWF
jgi:rhamnose utilization protein RhaD (predicted bifunctional aldolase and dehydrogenase)